MSKTFWPLDDGLRAEKPGMGLAGQALAKLKARATAGLARYCGLCAILVALTLPAMAFAAEDAQEKIIIGRDKEIYGTQEAGDLVAEARKYDPMFCQRDQANRDQAVLLYEKAIAAQPGAKLNAPLADRIAQLYAFYEDREKKVAPIRGKASQWWNRCAELTNPRQLLWAQAQMGLASVAVIGRDHMSALKRYNKILDMDVSQVELPNWKVWPDGNSDRGKAALEREQARLSESVEGIQARAAEKQFYVLSRISKPAALDALQNVASRFKGTQAGDRASRLMAEIRKQAGKDPWALPDLMAMRMPEETPPAPQPHAKHPQKAVMERPSPPVAQASGRNDLRFVIAAFATVGAAILTAVVVRIRRGNRLL